MQPGSKWLSLGHLQRSFRTHERFDLILHTRICNHAVAPCQNANSGFRHIGRDNSTHTGGYSKPRCGVREGIPRYAFEIRVRRFAKCPHTRETRMSLNCYSHRAI